MHKITFIGAGSLGFTRGLVRDILTFPQLRDAEIALMDIDATRLEYARQMCQKIVDMGQYPAKVTATLDRKTALKGADAVCVTILCGDTNVWQHDILIPQKYGIDINVGDTRGPSGFFRALRTIPTMLGICRDMERLCPSAIMLNYTNPMAMLCHAMQRTSPIRVTGLCHSVQGTAGMLAGWLGVPANELVYTCAGINHMAWYLKLEHRNKDLYPKLRKVVAERPKVYNEEQVRNEMFLALGYYVTESSGHASEYNWWFRKRQDLIKKYCTSGTGWNPGKHAYILNCYRNTKNTWKKDVRQWLAAEKPITLDRGHEYAASIINAWLGGELFWFNGNVPNTGLVPNLPTGACVEVPVMASRGNLQAIHTGPLPLPVVPLTALSATLEMMVVEASLTGDPTLVYQAVANDPLTAAKLSLAESRKMTAEMFRKFSPLLPQFRHLS